jgi:hypothetical protein
MSGAPWDGAPTRPILAFLLELLDLIDKRRGGPISEGYGRPTKKDMNLWDWLLIFSSPRKPQEALCGIGHGTRNVLDAAGLPPRPSHHTAQ